MNKTILYLINGLGIASKDSFDIKFNEMMPNLSMLMGNYISANIENTSYNYKNGFRNFSLGNNLLPTYNKIDSDVNLINNPNILNMAKDASNNNKVQIFAFLDNEQVVNQLVKIINVLRSKGDFYIFIHLVLRQKDVQKYDDIVRLVKFLEDKITVIRNVEIGTVVGEHKINSDDYYDLVTKQKGEKWPDHSRKLNYAKQIEIVPRELEGFYIKEGFKIENYDISFFMNYEDVDCNNFISRIKNVKLYTLFPMKAYSYAINIYEEIPPTDYFSKTLEDNNIKCLILTTYDRMPTITYNLCGLKEQKSDNITFADINDKNIDKMKYIDEDYQYIIFDYDIGLFNEIGKIKDFLMKLDDEINELYKLCDQKELNLFVTSLYGLYKNYIIGVDKKVILDYSLELPVIAITNLYSASKYTLKYGDTHALSNTLFSVVTKNSNMDNLFRKRGILGFLK